MAAGAPVEIISGREEARLIHLGVESLWPQRDKRVLIIDIGGGSAEIIASELAGEPMPVEGALLKALEPARFTRRAESRGSRP